MVNYDKTQIRQSLTPQDIFQVLQDCGGDPEWTPFGVICATICHNPPGEGSRKLYFYNNSNLFHCYTGCEEPNFDIFQLIIKIAKIQWKVDYDLNDAVRWVAQRFGISGEIKKEDPDQLDDWKVLANYERIQEIELNIQNVVLKEYDECILEKFNYSAKIKPWLDEGISQEVIEHAAIGYYPGGDQITIPHFDKNHRFVGLRGRALCADEAERFGKYRPLNIEGLTYKHPLGLNLYNLNNSKYNIFKLKKAIIFEAEKSVLKYQTYFGPELDISVACCGSNVSNYQIELLKEAGAQEIIIAFDRQFQRIGDEEYKRLKANLLKIRERYQNDLLVSFIFDKEMLTGYKDAPIDKDKNTFLKLYKERILI